MKASTAPACKVVLAAVLLFSAFTYAALAASELPVTIGNEGIEIGDRLRIRSKIMRVDADKQTLLISEKEVRLLEHFPESHTLKTRLLDAEGKPAEFGSFKEGEMVLVLGYSDPQGHVYAMKIQRVDPNAPPDEPASNHKSQFKRPKSRTPSQLQQSR
jgi:hypothetical protein